jgi:hypothetical protein
MWVMTFGVAESRVTAFKAPLSPITLVIPIFRVINAFKNSPLIWHIYNSTLKMLGDDGFYPC